MKVIHAAFVPGHSDDDSMNRPSRIILRADYLGFERQKKAQTQVQDARTPSKRMEGFVSTTSDFNAQTELPKVLILD